MATWGRIHNKKQSDGALYGVIQYVLRDVLGYGSISFPIKPCLFSSFLKYYL